MANKYKIQFSNVDDLSCKIFYTDKIEVEHQEAFKRVCPSRLWEDVTKWDEKDFTKANNLLKRLREWQQRESMKIIHVMVDNKKTLFFPYKNISEIYFLLKSYKNYKILAFDFNNKMEFSF